ncbi:MAG: anaerobic ribonucleoside triphosphate reductase [Bacteroidetes bacterium ADurb.Bin141]|nr:MAG: anaerobic ribonucleoside triphosphate reductase [Bacteroidetes bacterium ADurb.Bin141]
MTSEQLKAMDEFVHEYIHATNAATGSRYDANANVTNKNVITLLGEMVKPIFLQYNRYSRFNQMEKDFGKDIAVNYIDDINKHRIYQHDETHSCTPYCLSISIYPFLQNGSKCIGGITEAPKHLSSFCGGMINLMNQLAASVAGAVAVPAMLVAFDHFAKKDYGKDYLETHRHEIRQELEHLIYYLNEPSSGRSGQSIFWNVSLFDREYINGLYGDFVFPDDMTKVDVESLMRLQKFFLSWFNKERQRSLLTFPVITAAMVYDKNKQIVDQDFKNTVCKELSEGNGFFVYLSDSIESLSSCCRLRNEIKNEFSFTLGNVGEMTGSVNVITINMNRFIQDTSRLSKELHLDFSDLLISELRKFVQRIHKYHRSIRNIYESIRDLKMYPAHDAHFIEMNRQFSTIGINGLVEGAEFLGYEISPNENYMNFCATILQTIAEENKKAKEIYGCMFNTEFVPGENAGYKLAQWDKHDGYVVTRECYNSYFYRVEDDGLSVIEKAKMHGKLVTQHLDGGSAVHYNMDSYMTAEQYSKFLDINAYVGVNYFCTNVLITCCEEESCGFINKNTEHHCVKCGSKNISHATRIIGFLKKIKNFSQARQEEAALRFYHKDVP